MNVFYITGASKGLGKALALLCLENGDRVTGISRSQTINHPAYTHLSIDLSDQQQLGTFDFEVPPDENISGFFLINNAGTVEPIKYAGEAESADLIQAFTLNMIAPAVLCNLFIKKFRTFACTGAIINISSGAGERPVDGWSSYCSSKAGINMLSKVVAMEQEKINSGFKVVSVAPGIVDTPMQDTIRKAEPDNFSRIEEFVEYKRNGSLTSPEEAAKKILHAIKNLNQIQDVVFTVKA